jgi:hypothetical protein
VAVAVAVAVAAVVAAAAMLLNPPPLLPPLSTSGLLRLRLRLRPPLWQAAWTCCLDSALRLLPRRLRRAVWT